MANCTFPFLFPAQTTSKLFIPLVEKMLATSVTLPLEIVHAANVHCYLNKQALPYSTKFCHHTNQPQKTSGGCTFTPECLLKNTGKADIVLLPALWRDPIRIVQKNPKLTEWVAEQHAKGACFVAAGTGVIFLAEAGLLNGNSATTHWYYIKKLQKKYPSIIFKPKHLITYSNRIFCAGSVNSIADLMIYIAKLSLGETIANKLTQQFSHEIRKPVENNFFSDDIPNTSHDESIIALQDWLHSNCNKNLGLDMLAQKANLKKRTLTRRFKAATRSSPIQYSKKLRMTHACDLLQNTDLSITEIALQVGYNDPNYFSRIFHSTFLITPREFRNSTRGKLFSFNK